jgi:hypothetical protein
VLRALRALVNRGGGRIAAIVVHGWILPGSQVPRSPVPRSWFPGSSFQVPGFLNPEP